MPLWSSQHRFCQTNQCVVGKPGPNYYTAVHASALGSLIAKLPDESSPAPPPRDGPRLRNAHQIAADRPKN